MDIVETKVKIDKELLEKSKEYNVDIDIFLDTEFRKYVGAIEDKKQLKEHKHGIKDTFKSVLDYIASAESEKTREDLIKDINKKLCKGSTEGTAITERIIREAKLQGVEPDRTVLALDRLKRRGEIYQFLRDDYRVIE